MPHEPVTILLLAGAGFAAGTINAIAGGGSLLTLPLLIFLGLPATVANATNRIPITIGGIAATHSFSRRGLISRPWLAFAVPPALLGVAAGTWLATRVGDVAFERILAVVLVAAAAWIVWQPLPAADAGQPEVPTGRRRWMLSLTFLVFGVYSGFIQAGLGFLVLALFVGLGFDVVSANALRIPLILAFTVLSLLLFSFSGLLDWWAGLSLAAGQFFGAKVGVHLQILKGQAWVRNVLIGVIVVFAVGLLVRG